MSAFSGPVLESSSLKLRGRSRASRPSACACHHTAMYADRRLGFQSSRSSAFLLCSATKLVDKSNVRSANGRGAGERERARVPSARSRQAEPPHREHECRADFIGPTPSGQERLRIAAHPTIMNDESNPRDGISSGPVTYLKTPDGTRAIYTPSQIFIRANDPMSQAFSQFLDSTVQELASSASKPCSSAVDRWRRRSGRSLRRQRPSPSRAPRELG